MNRSLDPDPDNESVHFAAADSASGLKIGPYEILEESGGGSAGIVYQAWDSQTETDVVLRVSPEGRHDQVWLRGFLMRGEAAARVRHAAIVPVLKSGVDRGRAFLVSRFVSGRLLSDCMASDSIDFRTSVDWIRELARGLAAAHEVGLAHGKVCSRNVILDDQLRPRLMDLGVRRSAGDDGFVSKETSLEFADDQFRLGLVLFELLSGKRPDVDSVPPLREVRQDAPNGLESICQRALQPDADRRYGSMKAFADDLDRWFQGKPVTARPAGILARLWKRRP